VRYSPARDYWGQDTFGYTIDDGNGGTATAAVTVEVVRVNDAPEAAFTFDCTYLRCTFDASSSHDVDGSIASYAWEFGDGSSGGDALVTKDYAAAGTYTVILTVTDNEDAAATAMQEITVNEPPPPSMHVSDLDGDVSLKKNKWIASVTITVHDALDDPVPGAMVSGTWSEGTTGASVCATDDVGRCTVSKGGISNRTARVRFTVDGVTHSNLTYTPEVNHDPDGDSDGTSISVYLEPRTSLLPPPESDPICNGPVCTFGDGFTGSSVTPSNPYASVGLYSTILIVPDDEDATALVTIRDANGNPVEGVTVVGTWSGAYVVTVKAVTGPDGRVSFNSGKVSEAGATFTFSMYDGGLDVDASGGSGIP
jgi:PKD repeat protein